MKEKIKVSVIIPCYNQGEFLPATLDSVLAQSFTNWECIIVNDGSTDNTDLIANTYCAKDKRFTYLLKENGGLSSARNAGLNIAKGDFIQFLDSDDLIDSTKFEIQLKKKLNNEADVLVSDYNLFTEDLSNQFENFLSLQSYNLSIDGFLYEWGITFVIAIHAGLFKREFLNTHNISFNESVKAREDWIFWSALALSEPIFSYQDSKLAHYRVHNKSMTNDLDRMLLSRLVSIFEVDALLHQNQKIEFRNNISIELIKQLSKIFGKSENAKKANSLDYKLGNWLLSPIRKMKKTIRKYIITK